MYTHSGDLITYPPFRENSMYHKVYAFSFCLSVEAITGVVIKSACPEIGFVVQSCPTLCDSHRLQHTRSPCPSLFSWPNLHGTPSWITALLWRRGLRNSTKLQATPEGW